MQTIIVAQKTLVSEVKNPASRIKMIPSTIPAVRSMAREEKTHGLLEIEFRMTGKMNENIKEVKTCVRLICCRCVWNMDNWQRRDPGDAIWSQNFLCGC